MYFTQILKSISLFSVCFFCAFSLSAQTGPGGVGNAAGEANQPENLIWLRSDDLTSFGDGAVWSDRSGNGFNATNVGGPGGVVLSTGINGRKTLQFIRSKTGYLTIPDDQTSGNRLDGMNDLTIFSVFSTGNYQPCAVISKRANSGTRSYSLFTLDNYTINGYGGSYVANGTVMPGANANVIAGSVYQKGKKYSVYTNGSLDGTPVSVTTNIPDRSENICIGRFDEQLSETRYLNGHVGEVIVYRSALNTPQRIIVENYLGEKYGIAVANDRYSPVNSSFVTDLAGIGMEADEVHATASSAGLYLSGTGLSNGSYLMAAHNGVVNDEASINTGSEVVSAGAVAAWNRSWYVQKTGAFTPIVGFDLAEGILNGQKLPSSDGYVLLYRSALTDNYREMPAAKLQVNAARIYFTITETDYADGYYTLGTKNAVNAPLIGSEIEGKTYYSWRNGDWDDKDTWSILEGQHTPDGFTPSSSPTSYHDKVVIRDGYTVTIATNAKYNQSLEVRGELRLGSTSGHRFGEITGSGRIEMQGDGFPEGDASRFTTPEHDAGTVVFTGSGFDLARANEFCHVEVNLSTPTSSVTLLNNLRINGNLTITRGTLKFNNDVAVTPLKVVLTGDVLVQSGGSIATGSANARHRFEMKGNFTNKGTVRFTNRVVADEKNEATDGIVDACFVNPLADQMVQLLGLTNFYRIEIDKGVDDTYVLSLNADDPSHFNLLGYACQNHPGNQYLNNNALGLLRGTVRVGANIVINTLSSSGNYDIMEAARLWVDGGSVYNNKGNAIVPYGILHLTSGLVESKVPSGVTTRVNGVIKVEGGVLNTRVIRTSVMGASHVGGYIQSGGTVNLVAGGITTDYYRFCLTYPGNVFKMSGGVLNIQAASPKGGIFINSEPESVNVTGGKVICNVADANPFVITSRAPFWDLELTKSINNTAQHILAAGVDVSTTKEYLAAQPLRVLNDFRIRGEESMLGYPDVKFSAVTGETNVNDVYVGGSMMVEKGASYENRLNVGGTWYQNTTCFNQTAGTGSSESLYVGNTADALALGHFKLERTKNYRLAVSSPADRDNEAIAVEVYGDAAVESGTLDQGRLSIRVWGAVTNKDRMGSWYPSGSYPVAGGTPSRAQIRFGQDAKVVLNTTEGAVFGNTCLDVPLAYPVTVTSDFAIDRLEMTRGAVYLQNYRLQIDNMWNLTAGTSYFEDAATVDNINVSDNGIDGNRLFYTNGKASDGGLSLKVASVSLEGAADRRDNNSSPISFPVGYTTDGGSTVYHRPAQVRVKTFSDDGYVTIRPVAGAVQTSKLNGGKILKSYWNVSTSGFTVAPVVAMRFYYRAADLPASPNESGYVPGKVLTATPFTRSFESSPANDHTDVVNAGGNPAATRWVTYNGTSVGGAFATGGFNGITLGDAYYTAGEPGRFVGQPTVYYSRSAAGTGFPGINWNQKNSWSTESHTGAAASAYPVAGDVAIIGYGNTSSNSHHSIVVGNTTVAAAAIIFKSYSGIYPPRLTLNSGSIVNAGTVEGSGTIAMYVASSNNPVLNADIGAFNEGASNLIHYYLNENGAINIPGNISEYPNLRVEGQGTNRYAVFNNDIHVKRNMTIDGNGGVRLSEGAGGNIRVNNSLSIGGYNSGKLLFNAVGTAKTVSVGGNLTLTDVADNSLSVSNAAASSLVHHLTVGGNIAVDNGIFDLSNAETNGNQVVLEVIGSGSHTFSRANSTVPDLYRLVVDKGTSTGSVFSVNLPVTLSGTTDGASKAMELKNGLLVLNHEGIAEELTTGGAGFDIPSTAGLEVRSGSVTASNGSGISLDGLLRVSGGTVNMAGGDNTIEYSASGSAVIEVSAGELTVGGQVRGGLMADEGVLKYRQTGGIVVVGASAASKPKRGVLEVHNNGSQFLLTGGSLQVARQQTGTVERAALYLVPATSAVGNNAVVQIGNAFTPVNQTIGIRAACSIPNLLVDNSSSKNPRAKVWVDALTVQNDITLSAGTVLDCDGKDLVIGGDFTNNGTLTAGNNTTTFLGNAEQLVSGTGIYTFYHLAQSGTEALQLERPITVNGDLTYNGALNDGGNTITLKGDLYNNGVHLNGNSGNGIEMAGDIMQTIYGNGLLAVLTVHNEEDCKIAVGVTPGISKALRLSKGVLDIGENVLTLDADAEIVPVNAFGPENMVQTTKSYVDGGMRKFLGAYKGIEKSFLFPMGSNRVYTPVTLRYTEIGSSAGSITVKASHETHPTVVEDSESPNTEIVDARNALHFFWQLRSSGITYIDGNLELQAQDSLARVDGAGYTQADYITARLLNNGLWQWAKNDQTTYDEENDRLYFGLTGMDDAGISGDYTAGVEPSVLSQKGAIPDNVPLYTTIASGKWNEAIWSPQAPAGGPRGVRVQIDHQVTMASNFVSVYTTQINENGRLSIENTYGHRLGDLSGTGTLHVKEDGWPSANFTNFCSPTGGTLEFDGSSDYIVMGSLTKANNVKFSGTGQRKLPNRALTIYGNVTIDGADANLLLVNNNNLNYTLYKDLVMGTGGFRAGTGAGATIVMGGSTGQTISGAFAGSNAFNNLQINNAAGVTLASPVETSNKLTLTSGVVNSSASKELIISNTEEIAVAGGSSSSYVCGPMRKRILNNGSFTFPVGDAGRYGAIGVGQSSVTGYWQAAYYNHNPAADSYDPDVVTGNLKYVSHSEYWGVFAPVSATATVRLRWDAESGIIPDNSLAIAQWADLNPDSWQQVVSGAPLGSQDGGSVLSGTISFNEFSNKRFLTLGSTVVLLYKWIGVVSDRWEEGGNWTNGVVPVAAADVTIQNVLPKPQPVIYSGAQMKNLVIPINCSVTLREGASMSVNGALTNAGSLVLEQSTTNPSSFIYNGTGMVPNVVLNHRFVGTPLRKWYVGHVIDNSSYSDYVTNVAAPVTNNFAMVSYNSPGWAAVTGGVVDEPMKGYGVQFRSADVNVPHAGSLIAATDRTVALSKRGYHLVSNPYPAYLDLGLYASAWDFTDVDNTVWMFTGMGSERKFAAYNLATGISSPAGVMSRYVAPMQGFFVKNNFENASFGVGRAARVHACGVLFKSANEMVDDVLRINLSNSQMSDETVVVFREEGQPSFSGKLDSEKLMETTALLPFIYSIKDNKQVAINLMPEDPTRYAIPLGMTVGATGAVGTLTLKATNIDAFKPELDVLLFDKSTGLTTSLRQNPTYTFTTSAVSNANRFELSFAPMDKEVVPVATGVGTAENQSYSIIAIGLGRKAVVKVTDAEFDGHVAIEVTDALGRVHASVLSSTVRTEVAVPVNTQFYVVKVTYKNQVKSFKIVNTLSL